MTIKALYPTVRPTLNLDFAKTKALDPRVTFTRASTATFVGADGLIKTAASGVPRFDHNPTTGESLGLLVEEARTNLRTLSTDFSSGWIYNANVTVASGQVSPTGGASASLITLNAGTFSARLGDKFVNSASIVYTRSWFVKKTNQRYIWCGDGNNGNYAPNYRFDLDLGTGTVVSGGGFNSGFSITPYSNGYYRISVTCISIDIFAITANNTTSVNPLPFATSIVHDGTETFIMWGYQIEQASFPTSYIPTSGSTVTRAADVASITGANFSSWYNQNEGTIFAQGITTNNSAYLYDFSISPADGSQRIYTIGSVSGLISASSNLQVSYTYSANRKTAFAFNSSGLAFGLNGAVFNNAVLLTSPSLIEAVAIGARFNNIGQAGLISRFTYYPVRLPNAQLQALTR